MLKWNTMNTYRAAVLIKEKQLNRIPKCLNLMFSSSLLCVPNYLIRS